MKWFKTSSEKETKTKVLSLPCGLVDRDGKDGFRKERIARPGVYCIEFKYAFDIGFLFIRVKEGLNTVILIKNVWWNGKKISNDAFDPFTNEFWAISSLITRTISSDNCALYWVAWIDSHRWIRIVD